MSSEDVLSTRTTLPGAEASWPNVSLKGGGGVPDLSRVDRREEMGRCSHLGDVRCLVLRRA